MHSVSTKLSYKIYDEEKKKEKTQTITLPDAIHKIPEMSYKGFYSKPFHAFEDTNKNINGYLNIFSPMIAKRTHFVCSLRSAHYVRHFTQNTLDITLKI